MRVTINNATTLNASQAADMPLVQNTVFTTADLASLSQAVWAQQLNPVLLTQTQDTEYNSSKTYYTEYNGTYSVYTGGAGSFTATKALGLYEPCNAGSAADYLKNQESTAGTPNGTFLSTTIDI